MTSTRLGFIDLMKTLGMALIVLGHVGGHYINAWTPPIYPKQLGVAFFLFVLGFGLTRESRPTLTVLYRRLFEIVLIGLAFALLMSLVNYLRQGSLALSNYLPLALGANTLIDHFPANPTTWFIGTYIHILLLWALFRRKHRLSPWWLALLLPVEILGRSLLIQYAGPFIAYMNMVNWIVVFYFGLLAGKQPDRSVPLRACLLPASTLVLLIVVWSSASPSILQPDSSFPFMRPSAFPSGITPLITSICISGLYIAFTLLLSFATRPIPSIGVVRFFARNTLFIFIAHMPLCYGLREYLGQTSISYDLSVLIQFLACYPGLALVSELLHRQFRLERFRDVLLSSGFASRGAAIPEPHRLSL